MLAHERHELIRSQHTQLRMRPTQQRLHPDDPARTQVQFRLVHQIQFGVIDRSAQLTQEPNLRSPVTGRTIGGASRQFHRVGPGQRHVRAE